jgi:carbamoyl-phosphate synthase large subunit
MKLVEEEDNKPQKKVFVLKMYGADLYKWSTNKEKIEKSGAILLTNNLSLIELCRDKWTFYKELSKINSPYLIKTSLDTEFTKIVENIGLPFLLKPKTDL